MQKIPYTSVVESLMYAQICIQLNIAYITGMLDRHLSNPGVNYWEIPKRVLQYLQRTKDYMCTYRKLDQLEIVGYTNSDFVRSQDNMKSTFGYIYLLDRGVVSWKSAKQSLITFSTIAPEFIACYETSIHEIWLRNFVTELHILNGQTT